MSKIKTIKNWEHILTGVFPIVLAITFSCYNKLADETSFTIGTWIDSNKLFIFLFVIALIVGATLIKLNISLSKNDSLLSEQIKNFQDNEKVLNNKLTIFQSENKCLNEENLRLKSTFSFVSQDYYQKVAELLKKIFSDSELRLTENDRISIYRHVEDHNRFFMLGRYSKNSTFRKAGRMLYPDNIGFIGKAWRSAESLCENNLPDYETEPDKYLTDVVAKSGIDIEVLKELPMKGRYIFITKILKTDNVTPDMIFVFESMKERRLTKTKLQRIVKIHLPELQKIVNANLVYEPSETYATELGFTNAKLN